MPLETSARDRGESSPALAAEAGWGRTLVSLGNRNFRWYWLGTTASFFGLQMQVVARGWLAYDISGSPLALGWVSAAFGLPLIIFSLFGGVMADRIEKRRLLIISQVSIAVIALALALLVLFHLIEIWHLVVASFLIGTVSAFNMPARQAFIPELVDERMLMNAIALSSGGLNLARIAAPALGGVVIGVLGVAAAYLVTVFFLIIAAVTLFLLPVSVVSSPGKTMGRDLMDGLSYIRHNSVVLLLLTMALVPLVFALPYQLLLPIFAVDVLKVGASGLGVLMSVNGAGALMSSLVVASLGENQSKGLLLVASAVAFGVSLILFGESGVFYLSLVLLLLVGVVSNGYMAINNTLIQMNTSHLMRGRVMSVYLMTFGLMPLGVLPASAVAEVIGAPLTVAVGGLIVVVFTLGVALLQPSLRRL